MKFMATWNIPAAHVQTAQQRFVKKGGLYGDVKLLGQWHSVNGVEGWSLVETDSAMAINAWLDSWADLLDITITPVVEAEEAGGFLTRKFKKR